MYMHATHKFETIRSHVLRKLESQLSKDLYYHSVEHTVDVEAQAIRIAAAENIVAEEDLFLLKIACLYHDTGFIFSYDHHEDIGCAMATKELAEFGLDTRQTEIICGMINATKIPQTPSTKLEEIIADADLDYLGRDDFFPISHQLYLELKAKNFVQTENDWNLVQVKFFRQHTYFTATTKALRQQKKQMHLEMIEATLELV